MKMKGKVVQEGEAEGKSLVSDEPISFLGGIDSNSGKVVESEHPLEGKLVKDRVLIFPHGKGSTVGSYVLYQLASNNKAPAAIINRVAEPIVAVGAIISETPMVHKLEKDPIKNIEDEDFVTVRGELVMVKK